MKPALRSPVLLCSVLLMAMQPAAPWTAAFPTLTASAGMCIAAPSGEQLAGNASPALFGVDVRLRAPALRAMEGGGQSSCQEACAADRDACYVSTCPGQDYCEECEQQYNSCLANCAPPGPCPTTSTSTSSDTFTWYPLEFVCVGSGNWGHLWRKAQVTLRTTTVTTTQHCNGSQSQTTNTTYTNLYCYYYDTHDACWQPFTSFPPTCS